MKFWTKSQRLVSRAIGLALIVSLLGSTLALALSWSDQTPPGGPWKDIEFQYEIGNKAYYVLRDASYNYRCNGKSSELGR